MELGYTLIVSPHANRLYAAANKVFRSDDKGKHVTVISLILQDRLTEITHDYG